MNRPPLSQSHVYHDILCNAERILETWFTGCQFCRASGELDTNHDMRHCYRRGVGDALEGLNKFLCERSFRMKATLSDTHKRVLCQQCFLPLPYCYYTQRKKTSFCSRERPTLGCDVSGLIEAILFAVCTRFPRQCNHFLDREIEATTNITINGSKGPGWNVFRDWLDRVVEVDGQFFTQASVTSLILAEKVNRGAFNIEPMQDYDD